MKIIFILMVFLMQTKGYSQNPKHSETVELNGIKTYFEVYGTGPPLFLLHGITQSSKSWNQLIPAYHGEFEVYAVDLLGHGKSSPFQDQISVKSAAQILVALIEYLELKEVNVIGYSYGGEILFQMALINPGLLDSMIVLSTCGSWNAKDFPEFIEYLSYANIENLPWIREQQVSDARILNILGLFPTYEVNLSEAELKSIQTRTLLVIGDHDPATALDCVIQTKTLMPNAFLWIVPNTGHRVHLEKNKEQFIRVSKDFLNKDNW